MLLSDFLASKPYISVMAGMDQDENQVNNVFSFQDLVSTPFTGQVNALCLTRNLDGDFAEIVSKLELKENMKEVQVAELNELHLTDSGQLARKVLLEDLKLLKEHGASPVLNLIKCYERDEIFPFFPTDVYSFHVDRSPVATDTFLCTYYGDPSEILPNSQGQQKVLVPEIRSELRKLHDGPEESFDAFLTEHFFDLHYQSEPKAKLISLGIGNMWKLAVDHPESQVLPCLHRAPNETSRETRLMIIC